MSVTYTIDVNADDGSDARVKFTVTVSCPTQKAWGAIASLDSIRKANLLLESKIERLRLEAESAAIDCPFNPRIQKVYGVSLRQRVDNSTYLVCEVGLLGLGDTYSQAESTLLRLLDDLLN